MENVEYLLSQMIVLPIFFTCCASAVMLPEPVDQERVTYGSANYLDKVETPLNQDKNNLYQSQLLDRENQKASDLNQFQDNKADSNKSRPFQNQFKFSSNMNSVSEDQDDSKQITDEKGLIINANRQNISDQDHVPQNTNINIVHQNLDDSNQNKSNISPGLNYTDQNNINISENLDNTKQNITLRFQSIPNPINTNIQSLDDEQQECSYRSQNANDSNNNCENYYPIQKYKFQDDFIKEMQKILQILQNTTNKWRSISQSITVKDLEWHIQLESLRNSIEELRNISINLKNTNLEENNLFLFLEYTIKGLKINHQSIDDMRKQLTDIIKKIHHKNQEGRTLSQSLEDRVRRLCEEYQVLESVPKEKNISLNVISDVINELLDISLSREHIYQEETIIFQSQEKLLKQLKDVSTHSVGTNKAKFKIVKNLEYTVQELRYYSRSLDHLNEEENNVFQTLEGTVEEMRHFTPNIQSLENIIHKLRYISQTLEVVLDEDSKILKKIDDTSSELKYSYYITQNLENPHQEESNSLPNLEETLPELGDITQSLEDVNQEENDTFQELQNTIPEQEGVNQEDNNIFEELEDSITELRYITQNQEDVSQEENIILQEVEDTVTELKYIIQKLERGEYYANKEGSNILEELEDTIPEIEYITLSLKYLNQKERNILQQLKYAIPELRYMTQSIEDVNQEESDDLQKLEAIILQLRDIIPTNLNDTIYLLKDITQILESVNKRENKLFKSKEDIIKEEMRRIIRELEDTGEWRNTEHTKKDNILYSPTPNFSNHNWRTHSQSMEYPKKKLSNESRNAWPIIEYSNQETISNYSHQRQKRIRGGCQLVLQEDLDPKREPLILSSDGKEIVFPDEVDDGYSILNIHNQETLLLACPGGPGTNKVDGEMECKKGKLLVDGRRASASTTSCAKTYASSAVRMTRKPCGTGDEVELEIGFQIVEGGSERWVPEITVCHNVRDMYSLYAVHNLHGHVVEGKVSGNGRKAFSINNSHLFRGVNPDKFYSKKSVIQTLNNILRYGAGRSLLNNKRFIARGHLSPVADFIYYTGQMATMTYVNAAPQWQSFNAGNWLSVEKTVRDLAEMEGETLIVYTGIYGTQTLTYKGKRAKFYLAETEEGHKVIPVPEVFWKLVYNPTTKACIAVVGHNNVFAKRPPKPLCRLTKGWPTLSKLASGYTYFCDYRSFRDFVTFIPNVPCKSTLKNPKYKKG